MSLPLKRKRELSCESTGTAARGPSSVERGGHTGRGRSDGRRRRGRGRGHSFHIPSRHASKTVILAEVWKHRTHATYTISSQSGPVPPSLPTGHPEVEPPVPPRSQPDVIVETPQFLHSPTDINQDQHLGDFVNSAEYQDTPRIHPPRKADRPLRQIHRNKRRNQASTWMDQVIPMLLGPFMELLRRTKSGQVAASPAAPDNDACACPSVALRVTCVSWDR